MNKINFCKELLSFLKDEPNSLKLKQFDPLKLDPLEFYPIGSFFDFNINQKNFNEYFTNIFHNDNIIKNIHLNDLNNDLNYYGVSNLINFYFKEFDNNEELNIIDEFYKDFELCFSFEIKNNEEKIIELFNKNNDLNYFWNTDNFLYFSELNNSSKLFNFMKNMFQFHNNFYSINIKNDSLNKIFKDDNKEKIIDLKKFIDYLKMSNFKGTWNFDLELTNENYKIIENLFGLLKENDYNKIEGYEILKLINFENKYKKLTNFLATV